MSTTTRGFIDRVRVRANPEARQQARNDLAQFFANALK